MMINKIKYYALGCSLVLFAACEEENSQNLLSQTAVIDAYLFAGQTVDSLRFTKSQNYLDTDTVAVLLDNLAIQLSDGSETKVLENIGEGYYRADDFTIVSGKTYTISFEYADKTVRSSTFVPLKKEASISAQRLEIEQINFGGGRPPFGGSGNNSDVVEVTWDNSEGDYYYVVVENLNPEGEYIIPALADPNSPRPRFNIITEPSISDFHAINPLRDIQQYGKHRVIVYRVNPEYAALYQTSGNSSTTLSESPTNVENGLGIFSGVSSDTLYIDVVKI